MSRPSADTRTGATVLQVIGSVAASFFGVQSSRNRKRDFTHGNPWAYLGVGLAMTGAVALGFYLAVRVVLSTAGA